MEAGTISTKKIVAAAQHTREKEYWLNKLSGELVKSSFYYDCKTNGSETDPPPAHRDIVEFEFPGDLVTGFNQLSRDSDPRLHMILTAGLLLLIERYTGHKDIMTGMPVYKQPGNKDRKIELINTVVVLRNRLDAGMTFKELLLQVRQTITEAVEHANYPVELLPDLVGQPRSENDGGDFPLFDISLLLDNIHDKNDLHPIHHNITFSFMKKKNALTGVVEYNTSFYRKETIERIVTHFIAVFKQVLFDVNVKVSGIEILPDEDKKQLLYALNNTRTRFPGDKTVHALFEEQAERTPDKIAVCSPVELTDIFAPTHCFKKNPFIYERDVEYPGSSGDSRGKIIFKLLKTNYHNSVLVNTNVLKIIALFDGKTNIDSIYSRLKGLEGMGVTFIIYALEIMDLLEVTHDFSRKAEIISNMRFTDFIYLVRLLYRTHVIELAAVHTSAPGTGVGKAFTPKDFDSMKLFDGDTPLDHLLGQPKKLQKAGILLLGDTPGMPAAGLLYMAAFLRRNGVKAYCRFYDFSGDFESMKKDIEALLEITQPGVVAVSLKWFLYINRVLDMCRIVKAYAGKAHIPIKVVVGGDTASYYWKKMIHNESIDCIIRGDGELPLLKTCQGHDESDIPNCVYKKDGEIICSPISYINDESNARDIFLSHLDEILLSKKASLFGTFFIYTHLGCSMNCFYCGGCRQAQKEIFNRGKVFTRPVKEVRKDILEAIPYTSTFQFDFDAAAARGNLFDYCRKIWKDIDLSGHFCIISRPWKPSVPLIKLAVETFKYVYWDIDVLTLSERHRKQLESSGVVKPQPADTEILAFLHHCEPYENTEVRLNLIAGLPHLSLEDVAIGETFLARIMAGYPRFSELHWARLFAQPGAPIVADAEKYNMNSYASTFEEFLEYSKENFSSQSLYRSLEHLNYPYVYFNDEPLNSKITLYYTETNRKIQQYTASRRTAGVPGKTLTFSQLNQKANQLARLLRARGAASDTIAALMLTPSVEIPLAILAVMKAGGGYLPIDPQAPGERILYMLKDSNATALVTTRSLSGEIAFDKEIIYLEDSEKTTVNGENSLHAPCAMVHASQPGSSNLAYVIYTSGTTGKPKGVLLTHRNLVNYVNWFVRNTRLSSGDNALLTSSFAFDLGYTSIYPSLLTGGALHIIPRETYLLAERLLAYIRRHRVTYLKVTPSLFSVIVHSPEFSPDACRHLRLVVMGGEPINAEDVEKAHQTCKHIEVINHYGPTEATIGCIAQFIDFDQFDRYKTNPTIGKPIANTGVYILDKDLRLLPVGVPGELCISGSCLARGYLNHPGLTAEKFDQDFQDSQDDQDEKEKKKGTGKYSFTSTSLPLYLSTPLYRTGDLARWMPNENENANIEFLGRIDHQVKIRGYRVELGEIEQQLLSHPLVEETVVTVENDSNGDHYLCAYIIPQHKHMKEKQSPTETSLSDHKELEGAVGVEAMLSLFKEHTAQHPHETAVKSGSHFVTYESLDQKTNHIAQLINSQYDDRYGLSKEEKTRYKRQMALDGWGTASQEKLKSTTVFVGGAGGGASPTITQLALAGFGTIIVCDCDVVELSNLNRQFLHDESRIGMNKALSAKMTINRLNPHVDVTAHTEKLTRENVFELVGDAAIIFDMFDALESKFILSECAVARQIPHIVSAMVELSSYTAVFHSPHTPCFHCLYDKTKFNELDRIKGIVKDYEKNPLHVTASSLFTSTGFAVTEAIKILLGFENPAYNRFFFFNQEASENIIHTDGYKMMTYPFSHHFRKISLEQGFDWEKGWRGNFIEELSISPNPGCLLCSEKNRQQQTHLEETTKKNADPLPPENPPTANTDNKNHPGHRCAALLMDTENHIRIPEAFIGTLKAGKTLIPLPAEYSRERLAEILENSEARLILTPGAHVPLAEQLRNTVNKNIPLLNLDEAGEENNEISIENITNQTKGTHIPCIFYSDSPGEESIEAIDGVNDAVRDIYDTLSKGEPISLVENRMNTNDAYSLSGLREYLVKKIPDYMIPSYFVQLERIPLTPNGKIDRNALPKPDTAIDVEKYTAPRNETEETLVEIWSEILGAEKETIGIESNFFELGGNSLKLMTLVSKIYKELGIEVPITQLFDEPLIIGISSYIESKKFVEEPVALLNQSAQKKLFCFPPGVGFGVAYSNLASLIKDYAFYSFNFIEEENRLEQYVDIITKLQPVGPYILFGYSAAGGLVFEVTNALENHGCEVSDVILADSYWSEDRTIEPDDNGPGGFGEFVRDVQRVLEMWELDFLKDKVKERMKKYQEYVDGISSLDVVNANVHLIISEQRREEGRNADTSNWKKYTHKAVETYDGYGMHINMFDPEHLEKNADVIQAILMGI